MELQEATEFPEPTCCEYERDLHIWRNTASAFEILEPKYWRYWEKNLQGKQLKKGHVNVCPKGTC